MLRLELCFVTHVCINFCEFVRKIVIVMVMVMVFCVKWCIVMVIFILFHTFVILWWFFNEFPFQMFLYVRHATRVTIGNYFLNFTLNKITIIILSFFSISSIGVLVFAGYFSICASWKNGTENILLCFLCQLRILCSIGYCTHDFPVYVKQTEMSSFFLNLGSPKCDGNWNKQLFLDR